MAELSQAAVDGLRLLLTWPGVLYPVLGTLGAMLFAFMPGIGAVTLMALVLPITLHWEPEATLLLFGAFVGGATYMGSVTAILFNIPGAAPNAATLIDGHPLALRGEARTALACSATASALGSTIGIGILILLLPATRALILAFGPLEFTFVGLWGLTTVVMLSGRSPVKGFACVGLGLSLSLVGLDPRTAEERLTFGSDYLIDGLSVIPVLLGLFALAETIRLAVSGRTTIAGIVTNAELGGSTREGVLSVFRNFGLFLRSSVIGTCVGLVPGIGGTVASFVAYGHAVTSARGKGWFGQGDIRGVIAPEAANDAKDGGALLPVVAFGIPGSETTVLLLAAMAIHGITPGRELLETHLELVFALIWSLFLSNWITSLLGLALTRPLAAITALRVDALVVVITTLVGVGALAYRGLVEDLYVAGAFGVLGYFMARFEWPRVPLVIAFVLGGIIENNLLLSLRLAGLGRLDPLDRPMAWALAFVLVVTLVWSLRQRHLADTGRPRPPPDANGSGLGFTLALAAAGLIVTADTLNLSPAAQRVALWVALPTSGLLVAQVLLTTRARWRADPVTTIPVSVVDQSRAFAMVACFIGACAGFGLAIAAPLFVLVSTRWVIRAGWPASALAGALSAFAVWLLFSALLRRPIPGGLLLAF
jgi:TctA family transporter